MRSSRRPAGGFASCRSVIRPGPRNRSRDRRSLEAQMIRKLILAVALAMASTAQPSGAADSVRNVVLVHGAWADGSSWAKVIPLLEKAGLNAVAVQNPLTSFAEAVADLGKEFPPAPGGAAIRPDADGYLTMTTKGVFESFAPDLPLAERKLVAATQGATNSTVFGAKVANAAWKTKPTWYVVAANDRMIQPDLERKFAKAMNAKTITLPSSHVAMLSRPSDVAKLIIEAAKTAPAKQ